MKTAAVIASALSLLLFCNPALAQFSKVDYAIGNEPGLPVVADLSGDGDEDIATSNIGSNDVSVLLNDGSVNFSTAAGSPFTVGTSPFGFVAADFNEDANNDLDLATADSVSHSVTILSNDGSANFTASTISSSEVGDAPYGLVSADFDGDTFMDLAVTNRTESGMVTILQNDGSGSFTRADQISVGSFPRLIDASDFDGDGLWDLAVTNNGDDNVSILENTSAEGAINFKAANTISVGTRPSDIVAAELTGDAQTDLAVTNGVSDNVSILKNTSTEDGIFSFSTTSVAVGANPFGITSGEFNEESGTDLAVVNNNDNDVSFLLNNGSGSFSRYNSDEAVGANPFGIAGTDLNNDGLTDLVVSNLEDDEVSVLSSQRALPVEVRMKMTEALVLKSPYPNPSRSQATIRFAIQEAEPVRIELFDALGRRVQTLYDGTPPGGQPQQVDIDGSNLPTGSYLVRMQGAGRTVSQQITLLK